MYSSVCLYIHLSTCIYLNVCADIYIHLFIFEKICTHVFRYLYAHMIFVKAKISAKCLH